MTKEHEGRWKSAGYRRVKITIVRDPCGATKDQAFFTTDLDTRKNGPVHGSLWF